MPTQLLVVDEECKRYIARFWLKIRNGRELATAADEPPQTSQGKMQRLERAHNRKTVKKQKNKMTKLGKKANEALGAEFHQRWRDRGAQKKRR